MDLKTERLIVVEIGNYLTRGKVSWILLICIRATIAVSKSVLFCHCPGIPRMIFPAMDRFPVRILRSAHEAATLLSVMGAAVCAVPWA